MTDHAAVIREALHTLYAYTSDDANPPGEGRSWSHEQGRAAVAALEQELDALADVAAAGNEREKRLEHELAEAKHRAEINGLGAEPSDAGGPGRQEEYWQRRKLDASIRHLRDLEDYYRLAGGADNSPNQIRADRARDIYEQISGDYLNGKSSRPSMKARAEAAEAEVARLNHDAGAWEKAHREAEDKRDKLREALQECVPYVNTGVHSDQPWRSETATDLMGRVRAALAEDTP